jgi:hypothetical protein
MASPKKHFFSEAWQQIRPHALAVFVDFMQTLFLWAGVLGAHMVRVLMTAAGIDESLVSLVGTLEKWAFLASFFVFFVRIVIRLFAGLYAGLRETA